MINQICLILTSYSLTLQDFMKEISLIVFFLLLGGYPSRSTVISGVVVGSILLTFAAVCAYLFKESHQNTNVSQ